MIMAIKVCSNKCNKLLVVLYKIQQVRKINGVYLLGTMNMYIKKIIKRLKRQSVHTPKTNIR